MTAAVVKDPAKFFIRKDVAIILRKVAGFDMGKIFAAGFNPKMRKSQIQLLTQNQLEQENEKTLRRAKILMQMPPFLKPRERQDDILAQDERLNPLNLTKSDYMFIDISMNIPNDQRAILVRECNGTLRKASYDEREKMLQVYYPKEGRLNTRPRMFEQAHLEECLKLKHYMLILNKACLYYEPNDPDFIRITHRCYEYINQAKDYEVLYSTRFFGTMVFYLAWYKKLNNIIEYLLRKSNVEDCAHIVKLYLILHQDAKTNKLKTSAPKNGTNLDLIKTFILNDLVNGAAAELALVDYMEQQQNSNNSTSKKAASN